LSAGYDDAEDYLQRLKKIDTGAMRRVHSSGNIPSEHKMEQQYDHYSDDGKSTTTKPRQRIYFDEL
jgi:hypothetical protein